MNNDHVRISEFARLAGLTIGSLYNYNGDSRYGMPAPVAAVGATKFWSRKEVRAWIAARAQHRAQSKNKSSHPPRALKSKGGEVVLAKPKFRVTLFASYGAKSDL